MAFWVHVEKGYIIFTVYFSSFKSLESLARLLKKVLKSCETFRIQDFANANDDTFQKININILGICFYALIVHHNCFRIVNKPLKKLMLYMKRIGK